MQVKYLVEVLDPKTHIVTVKTEISGFDAEKVKFFLPSWSPGSYLMREYAKNMRTIKVLSQNGEFLFFEQLEKSLWEIDLSKSDLKQECEIITIEYQIYCHELTVRTSHVDESHAFLHGPSYLIGFLNYEFSPTIEFRFTPLWSKIHTGLKDISDERSTFLYSAENYDVLIDAPVEIGCHESDGFMAFGKEHYLVWYGQEYEHPYNLKNDIKVIVETVGKHFEDIPYDDYTFITHMKPNLYGGLEHLNSTALHYDGRKFSSRMDYVNWLALVAHEYFHTWNVKRIRPIELGPFNYLEENYTSMHWLTEGLTSFMDELFVLRSGLCSLDEYLKMQAKNLQRYFSIPGKKFHSLEQSSFNAWVKLYRPDENSNNSSVSYYLKGGLVFSTLHFDLVKIGKSIDELLTKLWDRYKKDPKVGVVKEEVLEMIEEIGNSKIRQDFENRLSTTEDIDFESYYKQFGMRFDYDETEEVFLGADLKYSGDRVIIDKVVLDGAAFKSGLNAGDEIVAINGLRVLKSDATQFSKMLVAGKNYSFTVSRLGELVQVPVMLEKSPRKLKAISILDEKLAKSCFLKS